LIPKGTVDGQKVVVSLPDPAAIGRDDLFEALLFCDISPETTFSIEGKKGIVFRFGDAISLQTPSLRLHVRFELLEGSGSFCGHISRSNRPGQTACRGPNLHEAYDWQIGMRTLRREGPCKIAIEIA
jgi:hypothetical protein